MFERIKKIFLKKNMLVVMKKEDILKIEEISNEKRDLLERIE
jgi:hypothetical protein